MVSSHVSESSVAGSNPVRGLCFVLFGTLTVRLSTQVYKWEPANLIWGRDVTL